MSSSRAAPIRAALAAGATAIPASILFALPGLAFVAGFDGLAYGLGLTAGLALYAVLASEKLASIDNPGLVAYLRARYGSAAAVLGGTALSVAITALVTAEISLAAAIAERHAGLAFETSAVTTAAIFLMLSLALKTTAGSNLRAAFFAATAAGLLGALSLLAWATHGTLIPHLSLGTALADIQALEAGMLENGTADLRTFRLYTKPFVAADQLTFVSIVVTLGAGTLVLAGVTMRSQLRGTSEAVRLGAGWAALFAMLLVISAPAIAGHVKLAVYNDLVRGTPLTALPQYLEPASRHGLVRIHGTSAKLLDDVTGAIGAGSTDAASVTSYFKERNPSAFAAWTELKPQTKAAMVAAAKQMLTASGLDTWSLLQESVLPAAATAAGNKTGMLTHASLEIDAAAIPLLLPALTPAPALATALWVIAGLAAVFAIGGTLTSTLGVAFSAGSATQTSGLVLPALIVAGATSAALLLRASDPAVLAVSALSIVGAALAPALVLGLWWRRASTAAACLSIATGLVVTLYYIGGTELFPATFYETWPHLSNASESAARKFATLTAAIEKATDDETMTAAIAMRDTFAAGSASRPSIANWCGIEGAAAAIFGLPASLLVMLLASLLFPSSAPRHDNAS